MDAAAPLAKNDRARPRNSPEGPLLFYDCTMRSLRAFALSIVVVGCSTGGSLKMSGGNASGAIEPTGASHGDVDVRFKSNVCEGVDTKPEYGNLDEKALLTFLKSQGIEATTERARNDLVYVDLSNVGTTEKVRLRVAILKSPADAGNELHGAVLQHGEGSWGIRRANLAVLAPVAASAEDAMAFAAKTKLACWGVFTIAGRDDTFVVGGAYAEL
jgi:hypothetical protein